MPTSGSDLRFGVIGLGKRSALASYAHTPGLGSRVVAACDVRPAAAAAARAAYGDGVRVTPDVHQLLHPPDQQDELDAVFVLTPDATHEQIAIAALEAGVAAYVEKPLAITVAGCDRILHTARRTGTPLYVGHNMRHMPVVLAMRKLIADGAVGQVKAIWCRHFVGHGGDYYFRDWHADRRNTTSLLLQKGAHDLDVISWLAGSYAVRVQAMGALMIYGAPQSGQPDAGELPSDPTGLALTWPPAALRGANPVVDVEDLSMVHLQLGNGVLASYQQCHFTPDYWRNYTVLGTEGRLENFGDTDPGTVIKVWNRRSGYRADADLVVEVPAGAGGGPDATGHGGADAAIVAEFLRFVRDRVPTLTSPLAARQAVAAGCAATSSLRHGGRPVDVAPPAPSLQAYFGGTVAADATTTVQPQYDDGRASMSHLAEEIASQPVCWQRAVTVAGQHAGVLPRAAERIAVVGCGTSWFMAAAYAALRESRGHGQTDVFAASEAPLHRAYDRLVAISRSGTTSEVLDLLTQVQGRIPTVAVTADPSTPIVDVADEVVVLDFADERSVVQTRFATSTLALLRASLGEDLDRVIVDAQEALAAPVDEWLVDAEQTTFLGRGWTVGLAYEAALKLRESCQAWAEAYPAMEYRHGPISIAAPGRVVWALGEVPLGLRKEVEEFGAAFEYSTRDPMADLLRVHQLCQVRAARLGLDPASPRNLTRSVVLQG